MLHSRFAPVVPKATKTDISFLKTFDALVRKRGREYALVALERNYRRRHAARPPGGRPLIPADPERFVRLAYHLAGDEDLRHRRIREDDDRVFTEAARRAFKDIPTPCAHGEIALDGTVQPKTLRHLVGGFKKLPPFFALDEEHGFDQGVWIS
jgi:hypothetical protein